MTLTFAEMDEIGDLHPVDLDQWTEPYAGTIVAIDLSDLTQPARFVQGPARCERKRAPR
jgi:hypothetical protein